MALQSVFACTAVALARWIDLLLALVRSVARWARAFRVIALVDLRVCVTEFDGDISLELVLEADRLHTRDGLDNGTLSMSDVANSSNVDSRLPRDNLG